jgi:dihydropteroate synthase
MAVLNVTPDSFYDGGRYSSSRKLKERIRAIAAEGADIIDIGGESTRPGASPVPAGQQLGRIRPAFDLCRRLAPSIPVSIDTTSSVVADAMLDLGAEMVNDISGLGFDPAMTGVIAGRGAAVVIMHIRGTPGDMQSSPRYPGGVVRTVAGRLKSAAAAARKAGISRIIVDPGIGFGKTVGHNYGLLSGLGEIASLGYPVLVGISRKSLIGKVLGRPPSERLPATMALNLVALLNGASFIRVHDVAEGRDAVRLWEQFDLAGRKERK